MRNFHKTNAFSVIVPLLGIILLWYLGMGWLILLGGIGFAIVFLLRRQSRDKDSTISKLGDNLINRSIDRDIAKGNMEHKIVNGKHKVEHSPMTGLKNRMLGYAFNKDIDSIKKTALDNSINRGIEPKRVDSKAGRMKDILFERQGKEDVLSQHVNNRNNQQRRENGYNPQYNQSGRDYQVYNQSGRNYQGYNKNYNYQGHNQFRNDRRFNNYGNYNNNGNGNYFDNQSYNQPNYNQPFNRQFDNDRNIDIYGANIPGTPINDRIKVHYNSNQYGNGRRSRGGLNDSYIEGLYHNDNIANKGVSDYYRTDNDKSSYSESFTSINCDFHSERKKLKKEEESLRKTVFSSENIIKKIHISVRDLSSLRKLYIEDLSCVRDEQDLMDTYNEMKLRIDKHSIELKTQLNKLLNTPELFNKSIVNISNLRDRLNEDLNNKGIYNCYNGFRSILIEQGEKEVVFNFYETYKELLDMYIKSIDALTTDCRMYLDFRLGRCDNITIENFREENSELLRNDNEWLYNRRMELDNLINQAMDSYKSKYLRYEDELSQQGDKVSEYKTKEDIESDNDNKKYEFLNNNNFTDTDVFTNNTNHANSDLFGDTMVDNYPRN